MTHHPHVHMIVPGGGISPDHKRWVSCRPRGVQIPIAPAAPPYAPSAVSFLAGFRTSAAEYAALSIKRPASETLNSSRHSAMS